MKTLLILLCSLVACAFGYWAEPKLRPHITAQVRVAAEKPTAPAPETVPSPAEVPERETGELLPEKVTLRQKVEFNDADSGLTMTIAEGSEARLLRINGDEAVIRIGESKYTMAIPISQTDLAVRLGKEAPPSVIPQPEPEVVAPTETPTEAPPQPDAVAAPEPPAVVEAPVEPAPETVEQPVAQPEPEAAPEPAAPAAAATDVVGIMRESIRNREVKKFEFSQVQDWKAGPDETVEGQVFKTGTATYKTETIFGVQTIQAKAFIKDGKVVRWIWPKSGLLIE